MKPNFTEIIVVLDRSGSMSTIKTDMEGGFNAFIKEQRLVPGECKVSLYQFDTEHEPVYVGRDIQSVPPMELVPRNGTALYDAVAKAIVTTGERLKAMQEHDRPSKLLVMIITDGEENSSVEYAKHLNGAHRVKQLVQHQQEKYNWGFVYLGVSANTFDDAQNIGIDSSSKYKGTTRGVKAMFVAVSNSTESYRGAKAGVSYASYAPPRDIVEDAGSQTAQPPIAGVINTTSSQGSDSNTSRTP